MKDEKLTAKKARLKREIAVAEKALASKVDKIEKLPALVGMWLYDRLRLTTLLKSFLR